MSSTAVGTIVDVLTRYESVFEMFKEKYKNISVAKWEPITISPVGDTSIKIFIDDGRTCEYVYYPRSNMAMLRNWGTW